MVRLGEWIVAGIVVPAALVLLPSLVVAVSMSSDDMAQTLGAALLSLVLLLPPGAALGAFLGLIVLALARRLPELGQPHRRAAVLRASVGVGVVAIGVCALLIRFTASDGLSSPHVVAYSVVYATIPTALAIIAFNRWRPAPTPGAPDVPAG